MKASVVHMKNATICGKVPESTNTLAIEASSAVARAGAFVDRIRHGERCGKHAVQVMAR